MTEENETSATKFRQLMILRAVSVFVFGSIIFLIAVPALGTGWRYWLIVAAFILNNMTQEFLGYRQTTVRVKNAINATIEMTMEFIGQQLKQDFDIELVVTPTPDTHTVRMTGTPKKPKVGRPRKQKIEVKDGK